MSERTCALMGAALLDALVDAGVLQGDDKPRRVVIDAKYDWPITIYVELVGDERLLNVATSLDGIEITRGE